MNDNRDDFLELVKAQHAFPGPFTMKFIGRSEDRFVERIVAAVRVAIAANEEPPYMARPSASSAHVSVTVMPFLSSPEQVLAIYDRVHKEPGLKMSL